MKRLLKNNTIDFALLQEPATVTSGDPFIKPQRKAPFRITGGVNLGLEYVDEKNRTRADLWVSNEFKTMYNVTKLNEFTDRDMVTCTFKVHKNDFQEPIINYGRPKSRKDKDRMLRRHEIRKSLIASKAQINGIPMKDDYVDFVFCSVYCPRLDNNDKEIANPICHKLELLIEKCNCEDKLLLISGDFNAHNSAWGDKKTDTRGTNVFQITQANDLVILNKGDKPTFERVMDNEYQSSIIDLTIANKRMAQWVTDWKVSNDSIGSSDHKALLTSIRFKPLHNLVKQKRTTDWKRYREKVAHKMSTFNPVINSRKQLDKAAEILTRILTNLKKKEPRYEKSFGKRSSE
jgi:hypothetical protein